MNIIPGATRLRPKCTSLRITRSNIVYSVFAIWPFVIILRTKGIERSDMVIEMKRGERNRDHCDCIYIITSSAIYLQTILYFYFKMHFNFVQQLKSVIFCKSSQTPFFGILNLPFRASAKEECSILSVRRSRSTWL